MSSSSYQYRTLQESEIRLVILSAGQDEDPVRCRLTHVSPSTTPLYETISYTWGDPNITTTIQVEDHNIQVTVNLEAALRNIRYEAEERILWADAICINQADLEERSNQVLLMGDIYAHAQRVIVWLGEETEVVSTAFDRIEWLNSYFEQHEPQYPHAPGRWTTLPKVGNAMYGALREVETDWKKPFANLLKNPWFIRRWVLQEIAKSTDPLVVCGKQSIKWTVMAEVIWSLFKAGLTSEMTQTGDIWPVADGIQSVLMMELMRRDLVHDKGSKLLGSIIATRRFKCQDPRDVIFSLLGIANDIETFSATLVPSQDSLHHEIPGRLGIKPNYLKSFGAVYHDFVLSSIINKRSILPLSAPYPGEPMVGLPSWVPDFARLSNANPLMYLRNESGLPYSASGDSELQAHFSSDYNVLHLKGMQIDTIIAIAPAFEDTVLSPDTQALAASENWNGDQILNQTVQKWFTSCLTVVGSQPDAPDTVFGLTTQQFKGFSRTLVCDLTEAGERTGPDFATAVLEWIESLIDSAAAIKKYVKNGDTQSLISSLLSTDMAIGLRLHGWCFCATESGRMGRCLGNAQPGDKVVILYGGEVPYVLRPRDGDGWKFVTSCYIDGLMDGEAMRLEGISPEEFSIH